jgi:hypothetical protein
MKLNVPFSEFKEGLLSFKKELDSLSESNITNETELTDTKTKLSDIKKRCGGFISKYISGSLSNNLSNDIINENLYNFGQQPLQQAKKNFLTRINERKDTIDYILQVVELSDPLMFGKSFEQKRENMSVSEKQEFLLSKLYDARKTNRPWDANTIFEINQVSLDNYDEAREIATILSNAGLIETHGWGRGLACKINATGKGYYEENILPKKSSYTFYEEYTDKYTVEEFEENLRNVEETLNRRMAGMEEKIQVIMDELKSAKEHIDKLDKKSFSQLIKGKLVDIAADKLITKETITAIGKFFMENYQVLIGH